MTTNSDNLKIERRVFNGEVRAASEGEARRVGGFAAMYNRETELWPGFFEVIEPGFFDNVLTNDVRALKNHNDDWVLGRTKAGTLRLSSDAEGLRYEYDDPGTTYSRDLLISIERGDIDQSSFGFSVREGGDTIERQERGGQIVRVRTLKKGGAETLFDVSPVTYPAYHDTSVALRKSAQFDALENRTEQDKDMGMENSEPQQGLHVLKEQERLTRALHILKLKQKMQHENS